MDFLVEQNAFQGKEREREKTNKARLIAKCYLQQPIVYFIETVAPVASIETIRIILVLAIQLQLQAFQPNMKSNFLNEELEKEVYVDQAPSNVMKEKKRQGLLTS